MAVVYLYIILFAIHEKHMLERAFRTPLKIYDGTFSRIRMNGF